MTAASLETTSQAVPTQPGGTWAKAGDFAATP
jgi:hypothetical protein